MDMNELLRKLPSVFPKEFELKKEKTALLLIDMQKLAGIEWIVKEAIEAGIPGGSAREAVKDMDRRMKRAIENSRKILEACRKKDITIAYTRIEALTKDCRDVGHLHRLHRFIVPPGSEWAEFFDEIKPKEGEIVLSKTCSSFFTGTSIDTVLRNIGIDTVIIIGFYTEQCITTAARDAADIGYNTIVIEDAITTLTQEKHDNAINAIADLYVKVMSTDQILEKLEKL